MEEGQYHQKAGGKPESVKNYADNVEVGDIPANLGYLLVLPFPAAEADNPKNHQVQPSIITFSEDSYLVADIIMQLKEQEHLKNKNLTLTFRNKRPLAKEHSMRIITKELKRQTINGLCLFTTIEEGEQSDEDVYTDECCLTSYLSHIHESGSVKSYELFLSIPLKETSEMLSVCISPDIHYMTLIGEIIKRISLIYGITLKEGDIRDIEIESTGKIVQEADIVTQPIYDKTKLILNLANPARQLKKVSTKDYSSFLKIFKEGEKDPVTFKYSEIEDLTFKQLYATKLQQKQSKMKTDAIYVLKIMDVIIKPSDTLSKAKKYFKNQGGELLNVVGKVVNEKMVFYHHINQIKQEKQDFSLDELTIPAEQEENMKNCRNLTKARAASALNAYFKKEKNIEPILIYTSELKYMESPGKSVKIYESLNRHLRDYPLLSLDKQTIKQEWRYHYASTLHKHLQKIQKYSGKVYRGISYDPKAKKGDIVTFKQFLSTSRNKSSAASFAKSKNILQINKGNHLLELDILEGYPIKEYSEFPLEDEILLEPFTQFIVQKVSRVHEEDRVFNVYSLTEIMTPKKLPEVKANFIIWIDPNTKESRLSYDKLEFSETTTLIQLLSTEQLRVWLKENKQLMQDPTALILFITNMTRKEGNVWNQTAGIDGLHQIRKYQTAPIFFFIRDSSKTLAKFIDQNINLTAVTIGDTFNEVKNYVAKKLSSSQ